MKDERNARFTKAFIRHVVGEVESGVIRGDI